MYVYIRTVYMRGCVCVYVYACVLCMKCAPMAIVCDGMVERCPDGHLQHIGRMSLIRSAAVRT